MSDLANRLVDAAEKEIPYFCDVDEYIRQGARDAVASTLKLFAEHIGPPWPSHEAYGMHTAWAEAVAIVHELEQK